MAMPRIPKVERMDEHQLAIRLSGNIKDVQITEDDLEDTESEDDGDSNSCSRVDALATLPRSLVTPPTQPTFGSVQVTESENVHFGDNIKGDNIVFNFKGPVVIKQVVHPKEQDNAGYEQTEDDSPRNNYSPHKLDAKEEGKIKPSNLKLWLKLSFSAVCIVVVGGVCAIVSLTLTYTGQENTTTAGNDEQNSSTDCVLVEGFPNFAHLKFILVTLLLVVLIILWCTNLLTKKKADKTATPAKPNPPKPRILRSSDLKADPLLIAPTHLRIVTRTEWLAQPVDRPLDILRLPVPWVIIQHTATESCHSQMFHVESRRWFDIGYNFLVAGDGSAYYGRGWDHQGAHTLGYNRFSVGIAFIGTFNNEPPPKQQLDACKKLIQRGVELGKIDKDYKLFAHRQLASTLSPGDKLFEILKTWPHFVQNTTEIEDLLPEY